MSEEYKTGDFGPIYTQFKGKPKEAIRFLIEKQDGEAIAALHREDIGDIDIVWGNNNKKNEGCGLKHIIDKHEKTINSYGFKIEDFIPIMVTFGILKPLTRKDRVSIEGDLYRIIISKESFGKEKHWVVSAFDKSQDSKTFGTIETIDGNNFTDNPLHYPTNVDSKDTSNFNPNQKTKLGAYEILSNNRSKWDFKGYKPTYQPLSSYDHLIDPALNKDTLITDQGDIPLTMENILLIIGKCSHQVSRLAAHLKAATKQQSVFNTWHWIKSNIPYGLEEGEKLRTPARSWSDSQKGILCDCDDYAIFSACVLKEMGYMKPPPSVEIVAFKYKPGTKEPIYSHIYTTLDGMILDGVMNEFNTKPLNVTKSMNLSILEGLEDKDFSGLGSLADELISIGQKFYNKAQSGTITPAEKKELKKILYVLNSHPDEHRPMLGIMKHVDDITDNGMEFKSEKINRFISGLSGLGNIDAIGDYEVGLEFIPVLSGFSDDELDVIQGLGDLGRFKIGKGLKKLVNAVKDTVVLPIKIAVKTTTAAVHVVAAAGDAAKDIATGHGSKVKADFKREIDKSETDVKTAVKDAGSTVKAVTTIVKSIAMSPVRGAVLLLLELNFLNHAKILGVGTGTLADALSRGYTEAEYNDHVKAANNYRKMFEEIGGDGDTFKDAINKGKDKKKFLGVGKNVNGLGELGVATEAAVVGGGGFMAGAAKFLEKLTHSGILQDVSKAFTDVMKLKPASSKTAITTTPIGPNPFTDPATDGTGKSIGTIGLVLGGLAVLGFLAFRKK